MNIPFIYVYLKFFYKIYQVFVYLMIYDTIQKKIIKNLFTVQLIFSKLWLGI